MKRLAVALLLFACALHAARAEEMRVWDSYTHQWSTFAALIENLSIHRVVFVGESHESAATHRAELALLQALMATKARPLTVGLEMFERDVQVALDGYVAKRIPEAEFLAASRPWPNYATDYRPLVEAARTASLAVVATNVPRTIAASVAKNGTETLAAVPADHLWLFARHSTSPHDAYWNHFQETMQGHVDSAALEHYFAAQCLKDDTMAESIADWFERHGDNGLLLHFNGAFHSDGNLGVVTRTHERMPKARIATVRIFAVPDLETIDALKFEATGDWLIFVKD